MELKAAATIEEVIGWNLRERRATKWTQPQFGQLIGTVLPKPWPAQTVSSAEKGQRAFAIAELGAIAHLLEVPMVALLNPPLPVQSVIVTGKLVLPAQWLQETGALHQHDAPSKLLYDETRSTLAKIAKLRRNIEEQTELIEQESRNLFVRLKHAAGKEEDVDLSRRHPTTASSQAAVAVKEAAVELDNALRAEEQRNARN